MSSSVPQRRTLSRLARFGIGAALAILVFLAFYLFQDNRPTAGPEAANPAPPAASTPAVPAAVVVPAATQEPVLAAEPTAPPTALPVEEPTAAQPAAKPTAAPKRVLRTTIPAPSLAANLVGEKAERPIVVYLPPSYDTSATRYPVIYYLPGYGDSGFIGFVPGADTDELNANGTFPEVIFVVANGVSVMGGSFYANSPVTGNWEDFVAEDLVAHVDGTYRTLADAASRGLAGHSMGGFGALNIGMHRADVFGSVYSLSPGLFDAEGLANSQMFQSERTIQSYLEVEQRLAGLAAEEAATHMKRQGSDLGFTLAYGAAFAPNPSRHPPYVDYPYSLVDGALVRDETRWKQWESGYGGIVEELAEYGDNLRSLRALGLDYGTRDFYAWIPQGVAYMDAQLTAAGITHQTNVFDGGHQEQLGTRMREAMLPFFAQTLVTE